MFQSCELPSDWNTAKRPSSASFGSSQKGCVGDNTPKQKKHGEKLRKSTLHTSKEPSKLPSDDTSSNNNKSENSRSSSSSNLDFQGSHFGLKMKYDDWSVHRHEGVVGLAAQHKHDTVSISSANDVSDPVLGVSQTTFSTTRFVSHAAENALLSMNMSDRQQIRDLVLSKIETHLASEGGAPASFLSDDMFKDEALSKETTAWGSETSRKYDNKLETIDTDCLISRLPYKKMLVDMFGGVARGHLQVPNIPYVTRAYEEAFMHEPVNSQERECARGKNCECMFLDKTQPFVCVEFLLPGEQPSRTPQLCVLCSRAITQQLYYDVIFDKHEFPGTIQRFGNIHSDVGEYSLDAMLISSPTAPVHIMPLPIVSHQRNRYTVYISGGIKRLKQCRVYFHHTPSCVQENGL